MSVVVNDKFDFENDKCMYCKTRNDKVICVYHSSCRYKGTNNNCNAPKYIEVKSYEQINGYGNY
jgi:hypothetical protein